MNFKLVFLVVFALLLCQVSAGSKRSKSRSGSSRRNGNAPPTAGAANGQGMQAGPGGNMGGRPQQWASQTAQGASQQAQQAGRPVRPPPPNRPPRQWTWWGSPYLMREVFGTN